MLINKKLPLDLLRKKIIDRISINPSIRSGEWEKILTDAGWTVEEYFKTQNLIKDLL